MRIFYFITLIFITSALRSEFDEEILDVKILEERCLIFKNSFIQLQEDFSFMRESLSKIGTSRKDTIYSRKAKEKKLQEVVLELNRYYSGKSFRSNLFFVSQIIPKGNIASITLSTNDLSGSGGDAGLILNYGGVITREEIDNSCHEGDSTLYLKNYDTFDGKVIINPLSIQFDIPDPGALVAGEFVILEANINSFEIYHTGSYGHFSIYIRTKRPNFLTSQGFNAR